MLELIWYKNKINFEFLYVAKNMCFFLYTFFHALISHIFILSFLYDAENIKLLELKLKDMKMIRSDTTTNDATSNDGTTTNDATSSDDPDESDPLPDPFPAARPCCSIHSSSVDSNHNEEDANRDNGNILENAEVVTEAVNVNTGNL